jgi:signal transduction histidine kinase
MPAGSTTSRTLPHPAGGLAVAGAGVVRSGVMAVTPIDTETKLRRAKERLYVFCQVGGWGLFLVMQLSFARAFGDGSRDKLTMTAINVMIFLQGLVLTHYARPLMNRWGWKEMSWRALVPRVLLMATVLSFIWNTVGFGYCYGIVGLPWTAKINIWLIILVSWFQAGCLLVGWLCVYFFYHIFERLQRMQVEQLRLAANVKEAELRALKSQVNPHFLFNSLNSLRALIDEDAPRAREAVTRLANMLRYSLQSGQLETVPFEDELRIVEDYLALEQIRHEERLQVRWEIAENVVHGGLPVPPMLLQTLVENAVKYGIGTRREGGELRITARIEGEALRIRVTNPGELGEPVSAAAARAGSSTGVGLRNASERLKLLYGDRASLSLFSEPAGCVTADVLIPLHPPAKSP